MQNNIEGQINIVVISAPMLSLLIQNLCYVTPPGVTLRIVDTSLDAVVTTAKRMEALGEADVFISAGGNAKLLEESIKKPFVEIKVTGFDILHALNTAGNFSNRVAVFANSEQANLLEEVRHVLAIEVKTITYNLHLLSKLEKMMDSLLEEGIQTVIGSSLVFKTAQRRGMKAVFIYSSDSIKLAINQAVQIAVSNRQVAQKAKEFKTIVDYAYGGIIATNRDNTVAVFNPAAEKITAISKEKAIGCFIGKLFNQIGFTGLVNLREQKLNQIVSIGNRHVILNNIPILSDVFFAGSIVTFQDIAAIQKTAAKIKLNLFSKGFLVKTNLTDIHGNSPSVMRAKEDARLYADRDAPVIILGESGTGKELFARGIHNASKRSPQPFVAINCAAFPETLLESELFGYDEGAFTGARRGGKKGLFELANHGSLFFDEVAEMPISLQTRLLRVLEERELMHIGGETIIPVDIRVIAATNKNLLELVRARKFREDLYYRMNVLTLCVPPLRERSDDIPLLASLFLSEIRPEIPAKEIRKLVTHPCLQQYDWPGNVRELRNCMERFAALSPSFPNAVALLMSLFQHPDMRKFEAAEKIALVLQKSGGNRSEAARILGISRSTLWRKLKSIEILPSKTGPENCDT